MDVKQNLVPTIALLCASITGQATAAITYTDDDRRLYYDSDDYIHTTWYNSSMDFNGAYGDVNDPNQISSMDANGFTAYGTGSLEVDASGIYSSYAYWSYFDIAFNLDTSSEFDLSGTLTGTNQNAEMWGASPETGSGNASITLYSGSTIDPGNILFTESIAALGTDESLLFAFSDVLLAGDYRIVAAAEPERISDASDYTYVWSTYDLDATVTPSAVPVPAAIWLFGSGLLGLIGIARRRY